MIGRPVGGVPGVPSFGRKCTHQHSSAAAEPGPVLRTRRDCRDGIRPHQTDCASGGFGPASGDRTHWVRPEYGVNLQCIARPGNCFRSSAERPMPTCAALR